MAFPWGYSKDGKKNSAGFSFFLKQRKTRTTRFILTPGFSRSFPGKKHAIRARIIKRCVPKAIFRGFPRAVRLPLSRPSTGSAPGSTAQVQPHKPVCNGISEQDRTPRHRGTVLPEPGRRLPGMPLLPRHRILLQGPREQPRRGRDLL